MCAADRTLLTCMGRFAREMHALGMRAPKNCPLVVAPWLGTRIRSPHIRIVPPSCCMPLYEVFPDTRSEQADQCFKCMFNCAFRPCLLQFPGKTARAFKAALLHKSRSERTSPFPGRTYPTAFVTGMPRAV